MSSPSLARWIPALNWLPAYNGSLLPGDILAGVTLAAYLLPAALGDASLANLPPQAGLYACVCSEGSSSGSFAVRASRLSRLLPPFRWSLARRLGRLQAET